MTKIFEPGKLGEIDVKNRIFMAPLTRNRAHANGTPHDMSIKYYEQRASAGLIVTEGAQISQQGQGYVNTPGIYNNEQAAAWKKITDAVHKKDGKIVAQLWHVGRVSHTSLQPNGQAPVAPSAIMAKTDTFTTEGPKNASLPRALKRDEIKAIIGDYVHAAKTAMRAGFDGVEVHAANGYLLTQFISTNTNKRDDEYGGSVENRARLYLEVLDAVIAEVGNGRVGTRLSPTVTFNDIHDEEAAETYAYLYAEVEKRNLAYLHVCENFPGIPTPEEDERLVRKLRESFNGNYIANGDYNKLSASKVLEEGSFAATFGRVYISNPDLVERFKLDAKLTEPDPETFYGGDETGYSDYPALQNSKPSNLQTAA
jgi:N-ethylmaleimide reductase